MTLDDTRRQQMDFDAKDSTSTMLHHLGFRLKFIGIAKFFGLWFNAAHRTERIKTNRHKGGTNMGDTIRYPNMGTVKKAADLYGLSPAYIRRLCKQGKIRYVNAGHRWLVNLDSLARYFEQGDPADGEEAAQGIRRVAR